MFTVPTIIVKVLAQLNFGCYLSSRIFLLNVFFIYPKIYLQIFFFLICINVWLLYYILCLQPFAYLNDTEIQIHTHTQFSTFPPQKKHVVYIYQCLSQRVKTCEWPQFSTWLSVGSCRIVYINVTSDIRVNVIESQSMSEMLCYNCLTISSQPLKRTSCFQKNVTGRPSNKITTAYAWKNHSDNLPSVFQCLVAWVYLL